MKKCPHCKIVFHHPDRTHCLYCDTILAILSEDDPLDDTIAFLSKEDDSVVLLSNDIKPLEHAIRDKDTLGQENIRYLIGNYFKSRTFYYFHVLSRNELKMGKEYKRFFIQPFNFVFLMMIPWAVINVIDSLFFHLKYRTYCPICKWKYAGQSVRHDARECAYNREYTLVINAILTGFIARIEPTFQSQAMAEVKRGQPSAYHDLCVRKNRYEKALDVVCLCFSCGLMLYVLMALLVPLITKFFASLSNFERVEIE